jgi:integrase
MDAHPRTVFDHFWHGGRIARYCAKYGTLPYKMLRPIHVRRQRDKLADRPEAATDLVKALRHVFKYALEEELVDSNPARDVPYLHKEGSEGFHTWTHEEVAKFVAYWPIGSKPRLALALLLYTGQRRSDIVRLGRQHEKHGDLHRLLPSFARSSMQHAVVI